MSYLHCFFVRIHLLLDWHVKFNAFLVDVPLDHPLAFLNQLKSEPPATFGKSGPIPDELWCLHAFYVVKVPKY